MGAETVGRGARRGSGSDCEEDQLGNEQTTGQNADGSQARGKWMIPAYKGLLYTSFGASMYMMCRLFLVRYLQSPPDVTKCKTDSTQGHKTWFGKN